MPPYIWLGLHGTTNLSPSMGRMKVPFYRHSLTDSDAAKIRDVINSPFLTSGPICKDVEAQLTEYFTVKHAKLVNSWTNGAVATLLALDIGPGDEVIVPAMSFIATANVVELVGATPVFVDCNPETLLITPNEIRHSITEKTKAIVPVHMYGQMCDIKSIKECLPKKKKIYIIEDCAHAFEAKFNSERPGTHSDVSIFSFYATKNITCGEGGAIITNDTTIFDRINQSVLHGMSASAVDRFKEGKYNHWNMKHLGTKANLPDILACLLPEQIKKIDEMLTRREEIAQFYDSKLLDSIFRTPSIQKNIIHSRHLYPIGVGKNRRDEILNILAENNIGVTVNYKAIPTMEYYKKKYEVSKIHFPHSYEWGEETISLPLYPNLKKEEIEHILNILLYQIEPLIGE
jgi:UDP-4-amino-4-deoxy-L-arabinose-oxoglutarate aminotransferase